MLGLPFGTFGDVLFRGPRSNRSVTARTIRSDAARPRPSWAKTSVWRSFLVRGLSESHGEDRRGRHGEGRKGATVHILRVNDERWRVT